MLSNEELKWLESVEIVGKSGADIKNLLDELQQAKELKRDIEKKIRKCCRNIDKVLIRSK